MSFSASRHRMNILRVVRADLKQCRPIGHGCHDDRREQEDRR